MGVRHEVGMRLLYAVPLIIFAYILGFLSYIVLLPWFIINMLYRLITARPQLPGGDLLLRVMQWQFDNTIFVLFGAGGWRWSP